MPLYLALIAKYITKKFGQKLSMSKLKKDIKGREYIFCEEKNMREYACCNLWNKEKVLSFNKYEAAAVEIFNNDVTEYFTFTPQFGRFEGFTDLFNYIEFWLKENEILFTKVDVNVYELSALIFKIDLETMELGLEIERISGGECFTYRYREEEKSFFDINNNKDLTVKEWGWYEVSYEDEEYEYEDIDPQF
tara:strand:- start:564 stop:1139 length:576 start_codon:yes stop_codon:yes gene_type:complete